MGKRSKKQRTDWVRRPHHIGHSDMLKPKYFGETAGKKSLFYYTQFNFLHEGGEKILLGELPSQHPNSKEHIALPF